MIDPAVPQTHSLLQAKKGTPVRTWWKMPIELELIHIPDTIDEINATFLKPFLDRIDSIRIHADGSVQPWDNVTSSILQYLKNQ